VRLSECLAQVQTFEDAKEGHQARIAGKRLRYIVEPLASCVTGGERLVTELADLQDLLGDWHDADVFSATIARASAGQHAKRRRDAAPGRRALAKRLEERGRRAFAIVKDRWPDANAFQAQVEAIAQQLSAPDGDVSEIERIYLPARLPADSAIRRQVFGTTLEHVGDQGDEDAVSKRRLATDAPRQNVIHEFALTRKTLSGRTPSSAG
jgi:hypothetical protein